MEYSQIRKFIQSLSDELHLWDNPSIDDICNQIKEQIDSGNMVYKIHKEHEEVVGVTFAELTTDIFYNSILSEFLIYIYPQYRGSYTQLIKCIDSLDELAIKYECDKIEAGASIGFKDDKLNSFYMKLGYKPKRLEKEVNYGKSN